MEPVSPEIQKKLDHYQELLVKWQGAVNLVSNHTLINAASRHFADSQQLAQWLPKKAKVLFDFGSGAGFPGLVLAMMRPRLDVHLVESDAKKCAFLSAVARETETDVTIHNVRIENLAPDAVPVPDVITTRALAPLAEILNYARPWAELNPKLIMLLSKGERASEEIAEVREKYGEYYAFDTILRPSQTQPGAAIVEIKGLCITDPPKESFS